MSTQPDSSCCKKIFHQALLTVVACVFPFGHLAAQNFEAVERRLGGAVADGEISLRHAQIMLEALHHATHDSHETRDLHDRKRHFEEVTHKIATAVESGKLSKEDAGRKLDHLRHELFGDTDKRVRHDEKREIQKRQYMELERNIKAEVDAGRLSGKEAKTKLEKKRRELFNKENENGVEAQKRRLEATRRKVKEALAAGEISPEDAKEKFRSLNRGKPDEQAKSEQGARDMEVRKRRYLEFEHRVKERVEKGEVSGEEAERQLIELRQRMFDNHDHKKQENGKAEAVRRKYEQAVRKVKEAVEAGKVPERAAEQKLMELRRSLLMLHDKEGEDHAVEE